MALNTIEDIEAYAIRMRKRGDSYAEISKFLKSQWNDETEVAAAIEKVRLLEKENLIVIEPGKKAYSLTNILMGGMVVAFGIFLTMTLWDRGWVSTISITMIGGGLIGMTRK